MKLPSGEQVQDAAHSLSLGFAVDEMDRVHVEDVAHVAASQNRRPHVGSHINVGVEGDGRQRVALLVGGGRGVGDDDVTDQMGMLTCLSRSRSKRIM